MMVALVGVGLLAFALLDGTFSGFRASLGRTGLIDHHAADLLAGRRGAALVAVLLTPAALLIGVGVALDSDQLADLRRAGEVMLAVYLPYGTLVLTALACYAALGWRLKYLASAVILGPFTFARPAVAILGLAVATWTAHRPLTITAGVLATAAVLAVEPLSGRLWYAPR